MSWSILICLKHRKKNARNYIQKTTAGLRTEVLNPGTQIRSGSDNYLRVCWALYFRAGFLKLWYAYHQWYTRHCSVIHGLSKKESKDKELKIPSLNSVT